MTRGPVTTNRLLVAASSLAAAIALVTALLKLPLWVTVIVAAIALGCLSACSIRARGGSASGAESNAEAPSASVRSMHYFQRVLSPIGIMVAGIAGLITCLAHAANEHTGDSS